MPSDQAPSIREIALRAGIQLSGAIPVVGSVVSGVSGAALVVLDGVRARRGTMLSRTIDEIIEQANGPEAVEARLAANPRLDALFASAVDAVLRTGFEQKRRLLATALAAALIDDARIDESELMVSTLAELDVPHVQALVRLANELDNPPAADSGWAWGMSPTWKQLPAPVKATLVRVGAARETPNPLSPVVNNQPADGITAYGRHILDALTAEPPGD